MDRRTRVATGFVTRRLTVAIERWPVAGAFVIARGARTHVDVVVAEVAEDGLVGRGEATAIYYHGETAEGVAEAVRAMADAVAGGIGRADLLSAMPRGAARNALDCALWSLEAAQTRQPVWALAGLPPPHPLVTAYTISLAEPAAMEAAARRVSDYPLLKLKLAGEGDLERVEAVRRGAPGARLIVDANEAWNDRDVAREATALAELGVELIEQPVRAGEEARLDGIHRPVPFAADESCQDRDDLDRCAGRFDAVNIKLDKAGGLTAALMLAEAGRDRGMAVMVGCMLSTSLGIAPAFLLAQHARWVDLDGPLLLARDRPDGFTFDGAMMRPSAL
jgi:L-alanine-DL-glutamate epimerase-like enolase superfamily enzyme